MCPRICPVSPVPPGKRPWSCCGNGSTAARRRYDTGGIECPACRPGRGAAGDGRPHFPGNSSPSRGQLPAQRRLGCCIRKEGAFTIQVSARLLGQPELLRNTLLHELLHTCYGCQNHGKRWKACAQKVGQAWGVDIRRTAAVEGPWEPLRREEVKYLLRCQSCGRVIPRRPEV